MSGLREGREFFLFFSIVKMHALFSVNAHTFQYTYLFIDLGTHVGHCMGNFAS